MTTQNQAPDPSGVPSWADVAALIDGGRHVLAWAHPDKRRGMLTAIRDTVRGGTLRAPHHTVSPAGMLGTVTYHRDRETGDPGPRPRSFRVIPGEVTLAHGGVLLLDDAAEFARLVIEGTATAVDDGAVFLAADGRVPIKLGAACTVLAVSAPCPCGFLRHPDRVCVCSQPVIDRFAARARDPMARLGAVEIELGSRVWWRNSKQPSADPERVQGGDRA